MEHTMGHDFSSGFTMVHYGVPNYCNNVHGALAYGACYDKGST